MENDATAAVKDQNVVTNIVDKELKTLVQEALKFTTTMDPSMVDKNIYDTFMQSFDAISNKSWRQEDADNVLEKLSNVTTIKKNPLDIKFVKTHPDAKLPCRAHETGNTSDSGYDVFAVEDTIIPATMCMNAWPGVPSTVCVGSAVVPIGIKVGDITPGYWFRIEAKSGLGFKHGIQPFPGIIDNGYRGDCSIKIYNLTDKPYTYKKGDKVAQLVFYPLINANVAWADDVVDTVRGEGGFGSSGK